MQRIRTFSHSTYSNSSDLRMPQVTPGLAILRLFLVLGFSLLSQWSSAQTTNKERHDVPDQKVVGVAVERLRGEFRFSYGRAETSRQGKRDLALALLNQVYQRTPDKVGTYARLQEARRLSTLGGDVSTALAVVEELAERYKIDRQKERASVFLAVVKELKSTEEFQSVTDVLLQDIRQAVAKDEYDVGLELAKVAKKVARQTKSLPLVLDVRRAYRDLIETKQQFAKLSPYANTLKKNPEDAKANAEMGRYLCLRKGQWARGLFLLAQSDDAELRVLAQRDLAKPRDWQDQIDLADNWWKVAEKFEGQLKTRLRQRAVHWYQDAVYQAKGDEEKRLRGRIAMVPPVEGGIAPWDYYGKPGLVRTMSDSNNVYGVAFSPNGKMLVSGTGINVPSLWDVKTGKLRHRLNSHNSFVWSVTFSPKGRFAYTASYGGTIKKWNSKTGKLVQTYNRGDRQRRGGGFYSVAVSKDGRKVLGGDSSSQVYLFDAKTAKVLKTFQHNGTVFDVEFLERGNKALTGASDNRVVLWNLKTGQMIRSYRMMSTARTISVTPDERFMVVADQRTDVRMFDIKTGRVVREFRGHNGSVYAAAISPDGRRLATGASDNTVRYWDLKTGRLIRTFNSNSTIYSVAFSPGSGMLASGDSSNQIRIWGLPR
ncbi:MAG: hypothetical protein ACFCD0_18305 [Gemmataceae bacterium]